ncbi:MAG: NPCBM/NEW2 domain-containing protein [bacterium]|nr:NPCBM/NEW2 domain-containing protein [bacterium]
MLTKRGLECLAESELSLWGEYADALQTEYCAYPDLHYKDPVSTSPYLCFVDGIPFHYIPHEPVEYNNWRVETVGGKGRLIALPLPENTHYRHCAVAFPFYFRNMAAALAEGRQDDAAKFAGCLCHALEDNASLVHGMEGVDGTDIFVVDRLVAPPPDQPYMVSSMLLGGNPADPGQQNYKPKLLGMNPQEAGFHLYTRFCETVIANRFHILPVLQAVYAGDEAQRSYHETEVSIRIIHLLADVLHTAVVIATGSYVEDEKAPLQRIALENVRAVRRPRHLSLYRFTPFIKGACLNAQRQPVPLALEFDDGACLEYENGLGMGAHAEFIFEYFLPANTFDRLTGALGLHPQLGRKGHVKFEWELDERIIWEDEYAEGHMASVFDLDVSGGCRLVLRGKALTDYWLDKGNNIVLADPVLIRSVTA